MFDIANIVVFVVVVVLLLLLVLVLVFHEVEKKRLGVYKNV